MSEINSILKDVRLPNVYKVKQKFEKEKIDNVRGNLIKKLNAKSWGQNHLLCQLWEVMEEQVPTAKKKC